jgi:hypothetical protein
LLVYEPWFPKQNVTNKHNDNGSITAGICT